jgi:branched-chain amino acid transport system ATP-binding protein
VLLEIEDLHARYGHLEALHGVSVKVEGGVTSIVGANGAGKSTLLRAVSGLLRPSSGSIKLDGENLVRRRPDQIVRAGISQVPEARQLFPQMTVLENLEVGATSVPRRHIASRIRSAWDLFPEIAGKSKQFAGTLSGGEQQMVAIARALISDPTVVLMDEPSLGLAPVVVDRVADVIRALDSRGLTVLLVEQNARMALEISSYAYVLANGRVALEGPAKDLMGDPRVVERYLGGRLPEQSGASDVAQTN